MRISAVGAGGAATVKVALAWELVPPGPEQEMRYVADWVKLPVWEPEVAIPPCQLAGSPWAVQDVALVEDQLMVALPL